MKRILKENSYFIFDRPYNKSLKSVIKTLLLAVNSAWHKAHYHILKVDCKKKKYNVSICSIFKNEAPYLKEWIEFHHLIGIEHFYMYNNNSEDNYLPVLQPYIDADLVTLIPWPHNQKQMECYMDCIEKFSAETKWLGFIDIDEFIVPKSTDDIYDFLSPFEKRSGAIKIYWRLYGSSGFVDRDSSSLVIEDFTVCWPKYCDIGKCFYNTAFGFDRSSKHSRGLHHMFWASWKGKDVPPRNIFGHICVGNRNVADCVDFPIQINHYFTKSYKEYAMKRSKGDVYFKENPHDEAYFYEHEKKCTTTDYCAYKYLIKLKLAMSVKK